MHTRTCTILVLIIRFTLIILATCTNKTPTQPSIPTKLQIIPLCQQDKSRSHKDSLKGQAKAQQSSNSYSLSASRFNTAKAITSSKAHKPHPCSGSSAPLVANLSIPTFSPTSTTSTTSSMVKASTTTVCTRTASKKKKDSAADKLQKQVALEKKQKKKQRASEKQAEEDKKKKTDQEKADANVGTVTVLPPNNNEVIVTIGLDDEEEMEINFEYTQAENEDWTNTEDADALARHGISPTHLFGKGHEESTEALPQQSKTPREQKSTRAPLST